MPLSRNEQNPDCEKSLQNINSVSCLEKIIKQGKINGLKYTSDIPTYQNIWSLHKPQTSKVAHAEMNIYIYIYVYNNQENVSTH